MPDRERRPATLTWRTSKASGGAGECVEIAGGERSVLVRDSRDPLGAVLAFSSGQWSAFLRRVSGGNHLR